MTDPAQQHAGLGVKTPYRVPALKPIPVLVAAPLDPRLRLLLVGLRRAALMVADVIGEFLELPKRE